MDLPAATMEFMGDSPPHSTERNDEFSEESLRQIQQGNPKAWEAFYSRQRDALLFSIRCRLGPELRSHIESEDILQSVVKDAVAELPRFESRGPHALNHYLHVCILNKIRSKATFYGAQKRSGEVPLSASMAERLSDQAPSEYADKDRYDRLESALLKVPQLMREVILLREVEGLTNKEAAHVLKKSPAATSKLHARALARLGQIMQTDPA